MPVFKVCDSAEPTFFQSDVNGVCSAMTVLNVSGTAGHTSAHPYTHTPVRPLICSLTARTKEYAGNRKAPKGAA